MRSNTKAIILASAMFEENFHKVEEQDFGLPEIPESTVAELTRDGLISTSTNRQDKQRHKTETRKKRLFRP